jgi:hypothetical protein
LIERNGRSVGGGDGDDDEEERAHDKTEHRHK